MSQETFERVRQVICASLGLSHERVVPAASFNEDLGADSLDVVELAMVLEDVYDFEIPDTAYKELTTVGDVVNFIERHALSVGESDRLGPR